MRSASVLSVCALAAAAALPWVPLAAVAQEEDGFDDADPYGMGGMGDPYGMGMGGMGDPYGMGMGGMGDPYGMGGMGDPYGDGGPAGQGGPPPPDTLRDEDDLAKFLEPKGSGGGSLVPGGVVGVFWDDTAVMDGSDEDEDEEIPPETPVQKAVGAFMQAAAQLGSSGYRFAFSDSERLAQTFGVKKGSWKVFVFKPKAVVSEKHGERERARFPGSGELLVDSLVKFIQEKTHPIVSIMSVANEGTFTNHDDGPIMVLMGKVDPRMDPKGVTYLANRLRKVALEFQGKMRFALLDAQDAAMTNSFQPSMFEFDQEPSQQHKVLGIRAVDRDSMEQRYYKLDGDFTVEKGKQFAQQFFEGKLEYRVEPIQGADADDDDEADPYGEDDEDEGEDEDEDDDNDDSALRQLKGGQVQAQLHEWRKTGAVVAFTAPWCGHCRAAKPALRKLAEELEPALPVINVDASEEEVGPPFVVEGFPTIYYVPEGNGKPVQYEGARSFKAMLKWTERMSSSGSREEL